MSALREIARNETWCKQGKSIAQTIPRRNTADPRGRMYLRELAVGEVLEERALADRAVADQNQTELVVEDRLYHLGGCRAEIIITPPLRAHVDNWPRAESAASRVVPQQTSHISPT